MFWMCRCRQLDSSHRDSDSSRLESQIWRLPTWLGLGRQMRQITRNSTRTWDTITRNLTRTWKTMTRNATRLGWLDWCRPMFFLTGRARTHFDYQCGWQAVMAAAPQRVSACTPQIVQFGYKNYNTDGKQRSAECKFCSHSIKDKEGTTSNFVRHIKTHDGKSGV